MKINFDGQNDPFYARNPNEQHMPVFTPAIPTQNAGRLITHSSAKIVWREMTKGIK